MKLMIGSQDKLELWISGLSIPALKEFVQTYLKKNSKVAQTKVLIESNRSHCIAVDLQLGRSEIHLRSYPASIDMIKAHGFEVSAEDEAVGQAQNVLDKIIEMS
jgi:hypothetical protein